MNSVANPAEPPRSLVAAFATRHRLTIIFLVIATCIAGVVCALGMPSSVFPETNFPRAVVLIDNGIMPADEMMATVTRPIEEAMKDVPGVVSVRSSTGRGSAEVSVFFDWKVDMVQSELFVLNRVAQLKASLPPTATTNVWRLGFNAFPVIGVSLTSPTRDITELWEKAQYDLKPRLLRIPGIARVDIVGGRAPEYHLVYDPMKMQSAGLSVADVTTALQSNNIVSAGGFHSENYTIYLLLVNARATSAKDLENFVVAVRGGHAVRIRDFARVERGPEPVFNVVNADGRNAVLLNIRTQPSGTNLLQITGDVRTQLADLKGSLPPDMKLASFYDQSLLVDESVLGVWEAIAVGLLFAGAVLYAFLKNWGSVITALLVVPVSICATVLVMLVAGLTFNLMTLGGIAAAIGLIIDDAIVVVEAIASRIARGETRMQAVNNGMAEIFRPLVASTLTPVVVFLPLAFLDGLPGVFFRSLALTMVASLLASLVLAATLTPTLAEIFIKERKNGDGSHAEEEGPIVRRMGDGFGRALQKALDFRKATVAICCVIALAGGLIYQQLQSDFMPAMDEGGFIIDSLTPWGTSLEESDRMMRQAEAILRATPEVESYSRRTGARLALAIAEPNKGDFLVKLRPDRKRSTEEVKQELRRKFTSAVPAVEWEFPGILGDLLGDLTDAPSPIEIKLFSNDTAWLMKTAPHLKAELQKIHGVVDISDGLRMTGPTITFRIRYPDAMRYGLTASMISSAVNSAMLGTKASSMLEGDRVVAIRVVADKASVRRTEDIENLPIRTATGAIVKLSQVADVQMQGGQLELQREDLRQLVRISAALEGRDLGSAMREIQQVIAADKTIPPETVDYGGLFKEQQRSFANLMMVLALSVALVFTVLLMEFRSFWEPISIVLGSLLALSGTVAALWLTGTTLNIVSFLGAIIGIGIVAKNGILMLDLVDHHIEEGETLTQALVSSGRRRLRPIMMTSLATILAMLPLASGFSQGGEMLRPLAIGIIGALCVSMVISLVATPTFYSLLRRQRTQQVTP